MTSSENNEPSPLKCVDARRITTEGLDPAPIAEEVWVVREVPLAVDVEMVSKCARSGIELISAISAPTSLAIETAERCGITLCAFVRETRATVFTHPGRVGGL